jgi:hypothetical protein
MKQLNRESVQIAAMRGRLFAGLVQTRPRRDGTLLTPPFISGSSSL